MKKIIILFLGVIVYSDVFTIITKIKKMETYNPIFKKLEKYDIFGNYIFNNKHILNTDTTAHQLMFQINAIFQNKVNINGEWYKLGDKIEGYKIVKINNEGIVLERNGKIKKFILKSNILKVVK